MTHKYSPAYPRLFAAEGERCPRLQHRAGRITLQCVRRVHGPEVKHLMDVMDRDAVTVNDELLAGVDSINRTARLIAETLKQPVAMSARLSPEGVGLYFQKFPTSEPVLVRQYKTGAEATEAANVAFMRLALKMGGTPAD